MSFSLLRLTASSRAASASRPAGINTGAPALSSSPALQTAEDRCVRGGLRTEEGDEMDWYLTIVMKII